MALRIYMIRGSSVSGVEVGVTAYHYAWSTGGTPSPFLGSIDKTDESANGYATVTCGVGSPGPIGDTDAGVTYVYPLPGNITLNGTVDLCIPCSSDFRYIYNLVLHIYVTQGTSGLTRGTLLNGYVEPQGTNELPPSDGDTLAVSLAAPQTVTPVNAQAGDYIVFELGIIARGPDPNNGNANFYTGCRSSGGDILPDAVEGDIVNAVLASHAPWFEFLSVPVPPPPLVGTVPSCCDPSPVTPDPTGALPAWVPMCAGGGEVDAVSDLTDGEYWG